MENLGSGEGPSSTLLNKWIFTLGQKYQHILDKSVPHVLRRWIILAAVVAIYGLRVYLIEGFYIVTYAIGIYMLSLFIGFLSPQIDPELNDGPSLPTSSSEEFRPFVRRLPEFKFWYGLMRAFVIGFVITFFSAFDVPVFWPILLCYWVMLFTLTMKKQIMHMRYDNKKSQPSAESNTQSRD